MRTIVLMGFSTAGKSSITRLIEQDKNYNILIDCHDSDYYIAKEFNPIDPHIYHIFLQLTKNDKINRKEVFDFISAKEKEFFKKMIDEKSLRHRLNAAGPFLHCQNELWANFIDKVKPDCVLLRITPFQIYFNLIERHYRHSKIKEVYNHPDFGAWDLGVTKAFDRNRYVLVREGDALFKITNLLNSVERDYFDYCKDNIFDSNQFDNFEDYKLAVKSKILQLFQI
ncbi:hypothetical protein KJ656_12005 [bacterium]|nr:hypothetical protein [bacterium]